MRLKFGSVLNKLFFLMVLVTPVAADAADYGRWFCSPDQPTGACITYGSGTAPEFNVTEAQIFLRTQKITDRLVPNDTINICDGNYCMTFVYLANGNWMPKVGIKAFLDPRSTYKNVKVGPGTSISSQWNNNELSFVVQGRWEWWDYYSNGSYIGSSSPQFVITSIEVSNAGGVGTSRQGRLTAFKVH